MNSVDVTCWRCGAELTGILLPLARAETCTKCGADLHVCRMCRFYDASVGNACCEPVADLVSDKTRANFCGYLELRRDAGTYASGGADEPGDALRDLFGLDEADRSDTPKSLDDLFGLNDDS